MTIIERLKRIREIFEIKNIDALIVPTSDPHQSEYVAEHWKDREWLSGFTGSAGNLIVSQNHAGIWTDSRYFIQAEKELDGSSIELHKLVDQFAPEHINWLKEHLKGKGTVAIHASDFSQSQYRSLLNQMKDSSIIIDCQYDIVSEVWTDRPLLSKEKVKIHDIKFCGKSVKDKINEVRSRMEIEDADYYLITALDDIAWLFNIRGNDVAYNPVIVSFAMISSFEAFLFIDLEKIDDDISNYFNENEINVIPYNEIENHLKVLPPESTILVDPTECNVLLYNNINCKIVERGSIVKPLKAIKNKTEISNLKNAMIKDGAALANSFYWLEKELLKNSVSEAEFATKIAEFRSKQKEYNGESFGAIIGYKGNGAIVHYHPTEQDCALIEKDGILLCDSGGQYSDGTTDITRTIALSKPSEEEKKHFTLVLKGHIALNLATFPKGTTGVQLDILARQFLWEEGLNYLHGTGHGVGFYLNVHEGPQGFSGLNSERGKTPIQAGMLTSNEPGLYITDKYGIRIENLVITIEDPNHTGYLSHEVVSLYPIDHSLIAENQLTSKEKAWINAYHYKVYESISTLLDDDVRSWFNNKCRGFN